MKLRQFDSNVDTLSFSIYDQYQIINPNLNHSHFTPYRLSELIRQNLQERDQYQHSVRILQSPGIFRKLSQYTKCAIEIFHPDGHKVTFPYYYRIDEPVLRVFFNQLRYASIRTSNVVLVSYSSNACQRSFKTCSCFQDRCSLKIGRTCYSYNTFLKKEYGKIQSLITLREWKIARASADLTKKLGEKLYDAVDTLVDPMPNDVTIFPINS